VGRCCRIGRRRRLAYSGTVTDSTAGVLIWDFDGTLAERPHRWSGAVDDALTEVAGPHGFSRAEIRKVLQRAYPWHEPEVAHPELATADDWWKRLAAVLASRLGQLGVQPEVAMLAAARVRRQYCRPDRWQLFPDTVSALDQLSALGWRHVLLSNHVPELGEILAGLGLGGRFEAVLNSAFTGFEKPHPRAFALALASAGQPRVAWMIGDNPVADVRGAVAAGLRAILVRTSPPDPGIWHAAGLADIAAMLAAHPDR
jgi:putative hydrolase of the HAD superfamily